MADDVDKPRVALVGAHGHGQWHLRNIERLAADGHLRLAGICDPLPLDPGTLAPCGDVPVLPRLTDLLTEVAPQVTVICTPIHTHTDLTLEALAGGSHVLLEKPPAATLADFDRLDAGVRASGLGCQIGFQSLGSSAVSAVRALIADGAIGDVVGIGAAGTWQRDATYFTRAPWAGRRRLDGVPVVDGALTNPFAHATITALALDDSLERGAVDDIEVELYRANAIEADDTSCLRLRTARGTPVTVAATLCAERTRSPYVTVHGTSGTITLAYKEGEVRLRTAATDRTETYPASDLLLDLLARVRNPAHQLLVPPEATGAFMTVVEAVRTAPEPRPIAPEYRRGVGSGATSRVEIPGIDAMVMRCAEKLATFSELAPAWAAMDHDDAKERR